MTLPLPIRIPLINSNEPEALLAAVHIQENQWVEAGTILCTLETTKSTFELEAETSGYLVGVKTNIGANVRAGDVYGYLVDQIAQFQLPALPEAGSTGPNLPAGLRITRPAREMAFLKGLELEKLPKDRLVTVEIIQQILNGEALVKTAVGQLRILDISPYSIILYGGGGHAKMLIDLLRSAGIYQIAGIIDDSRTPGTLVLDVPVLGGEALLPKLYDDGIRLAVNAVGGIGNIHVRETVSQKLISAGFSIPSVSHPSAIIEPSAQLSPGAQVFARAYIGAEAKLADHAIASTGCILSHDCTMNEYAIVSPGAILAGEVEIGERALVGMGVTINLKVRIGAGAKIGNSATIKSDVPSGWVVQAGTTWPG